MSDLSGLKITDRWPAKHPDRIQLYSLPTPNGVKASIMLEETGLPYEAHLVSFGSDDQMTPEFLSLNPNNKIPAMIDPDGPGGKPMPIWESGAILIYLAEKTGTLMPTEPVARYECLQWLMFQVGGVGPMFGQLGHFFKFAADKITDSYPTDRYLNESRRLLGALEGRLSDHYYIMGGDYTIADIATAPWVRTLIKTYDAGDELGLDGFRNVIAWPDRILSRPAVERGLNIPPQP
ncbi:MAG: glutathione S-transferase N-terminal domain-containing protein [Pseudomonadota bacterium]|nr:glutathione S-transferase N-terminal domain-containing protein [Pseudomonadota bacterium]